MADKTKEGPSSEPAGSAESATTAKPEQPTAATSFSPAGPTITDSARAEAGVPKSNSAVSPEPLAGVSVAHAVPNPALAAGVAEAKVITTPAAIAGPTTRGGLRVIQLGNWKFWIFMIILFFLIWLASIGIVTFPAKLHHPVASIEWSDLITTLFGASSVALVVLSLIIAVMAVFGWQTIKDTINQKVESSTQLRLKETQERLDKLENELKGRVISVLGHALGLISTDPKRKEPLDRDRLWEAVRHCQIGYEMLEKSEEKTYVMALNNLVYYSAVHGDASKRNFLLENARRLREWGEARHGATNLLLTFCRAVLRFCDTKDKDFLDGCRIADSLAKNEDLPKNQREEAGFYKDWFEERIRSEK
jgi:hypothetical protein